MTPSAFSALTPRWCEWCQQPLQGRSNKRFCNASCRNKADRHGVVAEAIDWPARAAHAEQMVQQLQERLDQLAQAQQAVAPLERRYDEFTQLLNVLVPELESSGLLANLRQYVEALLADYEQHPGLALGEAAPVRRVQILRQLHATIGRHQHRLQAGPAGSPKPPIPPAVTP